MLSDTRPQDRAKTALISVYDKTGIEPIARALVQHGVRLISTGNTFKTLQDLGLPVTQVEDVTGFPEILGGRVKSLHPKIHGGILADRSVSEHMDDLEQHDIGPIDFVITNLYPFSDTIARPDVTPEEAIEMIDIGGPAMIRAAAKNHRDVIVVVNPDEYPHLIERLESGTLDDLTYRQHLATLAFTETARYDALISRYFSGLSDAPFPGSFTFSGTLSKALRYGENPHQKAAFYIEDDFSGTSLAKARQLHGAELSYNNIMDGAAALEMITSFDRPTTVAVKHANPCGLASADDLFTAFQKTYAADKVSIFGGIIASNTVIDARTAALMSEIFLEVIIAPGFEPGAIDILTKKKNVRLLEVGPIKEPVDYVDMKRVPGGLLVQDADIDRKIDPSEWKVVTEAAPSEEAIRDMVFGWRVVKYVKSNAIVVVKDSALIGAGAGQMNRVQSARLALEQAGDAAKGAVLASDAFFPFRDVVDLAAKAGIAAIVQTGGSIRDEESIQAANEAGISMLMTGKRHFRH